MFLQLPLEVVSVVDIIHITVVHDAPGILLRVGHPRAPGEASSQPLLGRPPVASLVVTPASPLPEDRVVGGVSRRPRVEVGVLVPPASPMVGTRGLGWRSLGILGTFRILEIVVEELNLFLDFLQLLAMFVLDVFLDKIWTAI